MFFITYYIHYSSPFLHSLIFSSGMVNGALAAARILIRPLSACAMTVTFFSVCDNVKYGREKYKSLPPMRE